MKIINMDKPRAALILQHMSRIKRVEEYLQYNPDSTLADIGLALGITYHSASNYIKALRLDGRAHVSDIGDNGKGGKQKNFWSHGPDGAASIPIPVKAWAHGTATRYAMGRAV